MFDVKTARKAFAEKLLREDDFDSAFTKAIWIAYKAGHRDAGGVVVTENSFTETTTLAKPNANA